jgi:hypothetical protein
MHWDMMLMNLPVFLLLNAVHFLEVHLPIILLTMDAFAAAHEFS